MDKAKNALLGLYVRSANRLALMRLSREERGQALTDYLLVIALVGLVIAFIATPAKNGAKDVVDAIFEKLAGVVGNWLSS